MKLVDLAVRQPITVAVGVILALLAGLMAVMRVPVQMTPDIDSVVIAATTSWENASAAEIESDVIEEQEQRLGDLSGLVSMTSISRAGVGQIRLEFVTGTDIEAALAEVDQKLSEVPGYPVGVDEPEIVDIDPESIDYIAWIGLSSSDPDFDPTLLHDLLERRLRPRFERIPGVSEVGMVGAREREVQIVVDPERLARRGLTWADLVAAIELSNDNFSGGRLPEGKSDIRVRSVGRFREVERVGELVVRRDAAGPIYLRDVAEVREAHKEPVDWARARGQLMPFLNFQLESGGNLLETMAGIQAQVAAFNAPDGLLAQEAEALGLDGTLELVQTYDATTYVEDALALVRGNILVGGLLATLTLLLFLRSLRTVGIIAIAIPISIIASIVVLVGLGRSVNIISLAGMAFAVGMVVDNAIVVIENIFRHLELGKDVRAAARDGTLEVGGAVLASTLTTLVVFFPILLIEDSAGQLFRDIALAIMAAVGLSLVVSMTVIPSAAATLLGRGRRLVQASPDGTHADGTHADGAQPNAAPTSDLPREPAAEPAGGLRATARRLAGPIDGLGRGLGDGVVGLVRWILAVPSRGVVTALVFALVTVVGIAVLLPPMDYLPSGNRNIVFGILFPPPAYNLEQLSEIGARLEEQARPSWELAGDRFAIETVRRGGPPSDEDRRRPVPVAPGSEVEVVPPPLEHYFLVARDGLLFQAAISADKHRTVDIVPLFDHSVGGTAAPDVMSVATQFPLFRTGGTTGSALKIDLTGDRLPRVEQGAAALLMRLVERYGPTSVTPEPANFLIPTPELRVIPDDERLRDLGMTRRDVGLAVQANADGLLLPRQFEVGGELKDLKFITPAALGPDPVPALLRTPLTTPSGQLVDLESLAHIERVDVPERIKHANRQRAVTLQLTPPDGLPLAAVIEDVDALVAELRGSGAIPRGVEVGLSGSAGKLADIQRALMGDGTLVGTVTSSLFLAFLVVYLLMVVLFQSWILPLVIMVSVPLATLGGFGALAIVHAWSVADRYAPVQNLDVLTILGFVILAGVVVNNAILIVHQALHFVERDGLSTRDGIARAVQTRVRPIAMSTLTSVGGMLPLVLMPGSGSELYRGLGAVVVGGLVVSTVFTLVLVPVLLAGAMGLRARMATARTARDGVGRDEEWPGAHAPDGDAGPAPGPGLNGSGSPVRRTLGAGTAGLLLATLLSACTQVGPEHTVPEVPTPPEWVSPLEHGLDDGPAELARWWESLGDPDLERLVQRALEANLDLRTAWARVDEALAARGVVAGELVPAVDAEASWERDQRSDRVAQPFGPRNTEVADVGVVATWELDLWGRIRRVVEAADAELGARAEDVHGARVSLVATVATTYTELRSLQARLEIARSNLASQEQTLALTESRRRAGLAAELDVAQAGTNAERTRATIPSLEAEHTATRNRLARLLALGPDELDALMAESAPIPLVPTSVAVGVPADLVRRRPDVRAAERELAAQTARVGVAQAELYPRLTLLGSIGLRAEDGGDLGSSGSDVYRLLPSVSVPLFRGGSLRAAIAVEDARTLQALLAYEQTVRVAFEEADSALSAFAREHDRHAALARATDRARRAVEMSEALYREGLVDFQNVLDNQRSLLQVEDERTRSRAAITTGLIDLYRALGGGWQEAGAGA